MTGSTISNACDELHERLRAAIIHSVARHHGLSHERLREYIGTEGF